MKVELNKSILYTLECAVKSINPGEYLLFSLGRYVKEIEKELQNLCGRTIIFIGNRKKEVVTFNLKGRVFYCVGNPNTNKLKCDRNKAWLVPVKGGK